MLKAVSVKQPWAELIISGQKTIEIRSWETPYRGEILLHTGIKEDESAISFYRSRGRITSDHLFTGGYVGVISILSIVPMDAKRWQQWRPQHLDEGEYRAGFYAWMISVVKRFDHPVKGRGQVSIFDPEPNVMTELLHQL